MLLEHRSDGCWKYTCVCFINFKLQAMIIDSINYYLQTFWIVTYYNRWKQTDFFQKQSHVQLAVNM